MSVNPALRAVLIDDELMGINSLHILLDKYCPKVKSVAESRNPEMAIGLIENYRPDIVFLDINMPKMNGFELLENLKWKDFDLIFTTAHQEFALKALKSNAVDYLLKPIDPDELKAAVNKILLRREGREKNNNLESYQGILEDLAQLNKHKLIVHSKTGLETIETNTIVCMESKSNYTQLYLDNDQNLISSKTLKEYEQILCGLKSPFMRVHNSYIINLRKVLRYLRSSDSVVMQNEQQIPISKSRKEEFLNWLQV